MRHAIRILVILRLGHKCHNKISFVTHEMHCITPYPIWIIEPPSTRQMEIMFKEVLSSASQCSAYTPCETIHLQEVIGAIIALQSAST